MPTPLKFLKPFLSGDSASERIFIDADAVSADWSGFYMSADHFDNRYFRSGVPVSEDVKLLAADLQCGKPEALDLYTAYLTWRLTR